MKNNIFILLIITFILPANIFAQKVNGIISDKEGEPLTGVVISVKNANTHTISDLDGKYEIAAKGSSVLQFSYLGFEKQEIAVKNRSRIDVVLKEELTQLDEVVVIGYGVARKKDLTGAVSQLNVSDIDNTSVKSIDEALGGRIAGVQVVSTEGQPGSGIDIVIRGGNSITQDNSPLYVIDGFAIEDPDPAILDPADIESMDVLKDASATAIYGSRGANGVIIINTKRGQKAKPRISYKGYFGVQDAYKRMDVLNPYDYVLLMNELDPDYGGRYFQDGKTQETYRNVKGVDWQDKIMETAMMHSHNVSLGGGTETTKYNMSLSYFNQDGVIVGSGYNRFSGKLSLDQNINKYVDVGVNLSYTHSLRKGVITSQSTSADATSYLLYNAWAYQPVSTKDNFDLENEDIDPDIDTNRDQRFNPYKQATNEHVKRFSENLMLNAYASIKITKDLTLRLNGGVNRILEKNENFYNKNTRQGKIGTLGVYGMINNYETTRWSNENVLTFKKQISNFSIEAMGGNSLLTSKYSRSGGQSVGISEESLGIYSLGTGEPRAVYSEGREWSLASFFVRGFVGYKDRYLLTGTFRADGSSKFAKGNKWGYFPSVSAAWRISEEAFLKDIEEISQIKLRLSWGKTGNNRVGEYDAMAHLAGVYYPYAPESGSPNFGVNIVSMGNKDLKWETTQQWDAGIDLSFFNSRLNFTADYYYKKTTDLLLNADLPPSATFASAMKNIGSIENKGLEFTLSAVPVKIKNFTWRTEFNISFNRNKVTKLNDEQQQMYRYLNWDTNFKDLPAYVINVGESMGQMYGYVWDGVYQINDFTWQNNSDPSIEHADRDYKIKPGVAYYNGSRPGDIKYKNISGEGDEVNDEDRTVIGNALPDFIGGFNNSFKYKNFDLDFFFQFSYGNDILNANKLYMERMQMNFTNQFTSVLDRWTSENPTNRMYGVKGARVSNYSSRVIEDGSFLRLKSLTLGYSIPRSLLKKINIYSLRFYVTGHNLFTITNYSGFDPEVSTRGTSVTPGFDFSAYPRSRNFIFGANVTF